MRGLVVLGTDTDVGKSIVSAGLLMAASRNDFPMKYWKPVETGGSEAQTIQRLTKLPDLFFHQTLYSFSEPISPEIASRRENAEITLKELEKSFKEKAASPFLLVESLGGILAPLSKQLSQWEWIKKLGFPALLVAQDRVGTINHTLLTLQFCEAHGIDVVGVILNRKTKDVGNTESIAERTELPVFGSIPEGEETEVLRNQFFDDFIFFLRTNFLKPSL